MSLLQIANLQFLDWSEIDLALEAREVVCLRGDSGSGKSLFLKAIADLIVNEGTLVLEGRERETFEPTDWRRSVAYLPAEILWWEETVGDHFKDAPGPELLSRLRLEKDALDWAPSRLSMGERQRLGVLRMLDRHPKVLLLDEPSANLDDAATAVVEDVILEYLRKKSGAAVWVTHSVAQAKKVSDRSFIMKDKAIRLESEAGLVS